MKKVDLDSKIKKKLINTLKKYPEINKAVVFGSRARGMNKKNSDIDLAIYCQNSFPTGLRLDLDETVGIYKIDVINMNSLTNKTLKKMIETEGVEIYLNPSPSYQKKTYK